MMLFITSHSEKTLPVPIYWQLRFVHFGLVFAIDVTGWRKEKAAQIAIGSLKNWVLSHSSTDTTDLYVALKREAEAIVSECSFNYDEEPFIAIRRAQRVATSEKTLAGYYGGDEGIVTLEAGEVAGL